MAPDTVSVALAGAPSGAGTTYPAFLAEPRLALSTSWRCLLSSTTKPLRGWMFWRREFWIRPAFLVLVALGFLVAVPFIARHGVQSVQAQHLVDARVGCDDESAAPGSGPNRCLKPVIGQLSGPYLTRRVPGHGWSVWVDGEKYDGFDLEEGWDDQVAQVRDTATVWTWRDDVVGVEVPDGVRAQSGGPAGASVLAPVWGLGGRGAAQAFLFAVWCMGGAVAATDYASRKRRVRGSWWVIDGPYVSPASPWGTALLAPASLGALPMLFGFPWWWVWVAVFLAGLVVVASWLQPWSARRNAYQGRHALGPN
jgi:hypothetical protein